VFHLEISHLIVAGVTALGSFGAYYVRTQIKLHGGVGARPLARRIEAIAERLMSKIDALSSAVNSLNVTVARSDEQHAQARREIDKLDSRVQRLEERG
jgi:outer membrane murein-binding lipoprotein Lpp